jgi:hypothetical protein
MKRNATELTNLLIKKERSRVNKLRGLMPPFLIFIKIKTWG